MNLVNLVGAFGFLILIWYVLKIISGWKLFTKAGEPGWASIIPFYNSYIEFKIYWGNGWLFLIPLVCVLLSAIPVLGTILAIVSFVMVIIIRYKQASAFGQSGAFALGCIFLNAIFSMILAFGNYTYQGPKNS